MNNKKDGNGRRKRWNVVKKHGWQGWNERTTLMERTTSPVLSGEILKSTAFFNDGLCKLLEDSVHISALSWPQTLQEANVASMAGYKQGQVRVLLHCLHWNGCKQNNGFNSLFSVVSHDVILPVSVHVSLINKIAIAGMLGNASIRCISHQPIIIYV